MLNESAVFISTASHLLNVSDFADPNSSLFQESKHHRKNQHTHSSTHPSLSIMKDLKEFHLASKFCCIGFKVPVARRGVGSQTFSKFVLHLVANKVGPTKRVRHQHDKDHHMWAKLAVPRERSTSRAKHSSTLDEASHPHLRLILEVPSSEPCA